MNIFYIILKFVKKIIQTIIKFFKMQFEFLKKTWKTQGIKGILILILNLVIAFFGGFIYEKTHSKKSRSGRTNNTTERGRIRQPGHIDRKRGAINDIPDERRLGSDKEGWQDRNSKRDISDNMREPPEAGKVFSSVNTKRKRNIADNTGKPETQKQKNSEWDINTQRRTKDR